MTPEGVRARIAAELTGGWNETNPRANPHGLELQRCLLAEPERRTFLDSFHEDREIELWLVLEEDPDHHRGYQIVYSEERDSYGLAIERRSTHAVLLGYYGTFLETVAGM